MNAISDDLLRAALDDAAATVAPGDVRPLTVPVRTRRRWVVPVGVGTAAVLALALVVGLTRARTPAVPPTSLAAYTGAKYVLVGAGTLGKPLSVNDAATGKRIATVPAPRGTTGFWDVAGTGDNRTFLLSTFDFEHSLMHFYRLRLSENGTPETPSELPRLTSHGLRGIGEHLLAATKGGTRLAFVTETGAKAHYTSKSFSAVIGRRIHERVTIVDTATGDHRTIAVPQGEAPEDLAFAADGRHIAYTTETPIRHGLRVLATTTGTVHPVELGDAGAELGDVAIGPDSTHIVALVFTKGESRLVWYSLDTLKITREMALGRYRFPNTPASAGPFVSGNTVVVMVGDTVYRATGTGLSKRHADPRTIKLGREGTW